MMYSGADGFLAGALPFVRAAVAAGEPILVAVNAARIAAMQRALEGDADADAVMFADMTEIGENPARIIPAWRAFVAAHGADGQQVHGIGEPIWAGRSRAELVECQRHESLLNVAFAESGALSLLCPYDVSELGVDVIDEACRSHPYVMRDGSSEVSTAWPGLDAMASPFGGPLDPPPADVEVVPFVSVDQLASIRRLLRQLGASALFEVEQVFDFTLAVDEAVVNSLRHGGGSGTLIAWVEDDGLVCDIRDGGQDGRAPIDEPLVGRVLPSTHQIGGRGLWLANQVCSLVQIRSTDEGTVVRVRLNRRVQRT